MHKCTLGVHEVKLVVDATERFSNGGGVGNHADGALDSGKVATRNDSRRLVVNAALETSGAPVDKLNGALGLDGRNSSVDVLGDNVTAVHEAARHVLSVTRIALGHHVGRLKDRVGNLGNRELLVKSLLSRDDGSVRRKHEVDAGVRHQVGLELGHINVQGTIETKRGRKRRNDLSNEAVEVRVRGALNIEIAPAHIIESLVVKAEGAIGVLQKGVGGKDGVVRLDDSRGHLRRRRDSKRELGLPSIIDGQSLKEERAKSAPGATSCSVEHKESLKAGAVVSELTDAIKDEINNLLSDGVMTTSIVVSGILLAIDDLFGMVELTVRPMADFVTNGWLKVDVHSTRNVLPSASFRKESVEGIIALSDRLVFMHGAIRFNAVLEAVKLPAVVTSLDTGLTKVDRDAFCMRRDNGVRINGIQCVIFT